MNLNILLITETLSTSIIGPTQKGPPDWRNILAYFDWLLLTDRYVVTGCLLIDLVMLIDNMIVRLASPAARGFLSPLLSLSLLSLSLLFSLLSSFYLFSILSLSFFCLLSSLFAAKENLWDRGKEGKRYAEFSLRTLQLRTACIK